MNGTQARNNPKDVPGTEYLSWLGTQWRPDLAYPQLTDDMIDRLHSYGQEEVVPADVCLYSHGDRNIDLFVVLEGGIDVSMPDAAGGTKVYNEIRSGNFGGEFNLLNSQGAVVEARTVAPSVLLRIRRGNLQNLMRAEGDIANLIVQACIWRRIKIVEAAVSGAIVTGHSDDSQMILLRRFFLRNIYPHRIIEVGETGPELVKTRYPTVTLPNGKVLERPEIPDLADELGITELPDSKAIFDVIVVGAGPAGLASAVYAASEGLSTVIIEGIAPGGQAGTSSKIENYLGFPTGIGGQQLAIRAQMQALKFGVRFAISRPVVTISKKNRIHRLTLLGGQALCARAVVVATGAQYRTLNVKNFRDYENRGLFYAATSMEGVLCRNHEVIVVGGGNSAGQASLFLSGIARHVHHVVRGPSLASTMSQYLISRIDKSKKISVHTNSEIVRLGGAPSLSHVSWKDRVTGESTECEIGAVFVMIGAEPNTGWLFGSVQLDDKGFVVTGGEHGFEPTPYATSSPGIFAVGDVRAHSVKRIASAVGEGSVVISDVHRYLTSCQDSADTDRVSAATVTGTRTITDPAR
ncbi:FAD-binding protein [Acidipila sp. EB88]|nr:FAD-binding protein [Acidipila sp. EB88]